jgi:microcystin-dependent protein
MANLTITQLSKAYPLSGDEIVPVSQADYKKNGTVTTFATTISGIAEYVREAAIPPGVIWTYAVGVDPVKRSIPKGWLLCDGSAVQIKSYRRLYEVIGDTYGVPSLPGVLFKLPSLRGRFILGYSSLSATLTPGFGSFHGNPFTFGQYGGEFNHTLTESEIPSHTHQVDVTPGDEHFLAWPLQPGDYRDVEQEINLPPNGPKSTLVQVDFHPTMLSYGGSRPHNNTPPYLVMNYIIKY